jgi:hypothetical protein
MAEIKDNSEEEFFKRHRANITVVEDGTIPNLDNDPVFRKKLEDAIEAMEECPIPEHLIKRLNED